GKFFGFRTISTSAGNPSQLSGKELVKRIKRTPHDPVLVMFDDSGIVGLGKGEESLRYVATHHDITVLGALAVAARTHGDEWTRVHVSIDCEGNLCSHGVDKSGVPDIEDGRVNGDTVYVLDQLNIPVIVGIGDIGKMRGIDDYRKGAPITRKAIAIILERNGMDVSRYDKENVFFEEP
ncbi:MAG: stage V sporulation protein AE, partial [Bacilli bacterium]